MNEDATTIKNWRNQAVGAAFQQEIEQLAAYTPGALLIAQWPQVKFFKNKTAKIVKEAWPDYILFLYQEPFIFDAKTTMQAETYRPSERHQFDNLQIAAANGIISFYLVNWLTYKEIEIFAVRETDTWPVKYPYQSGSFRVMVDGNWVQTLCDHYLGKAYKDTLNKVFKD